MIDLIKLPTHHGEIHVLQGGAVGEHKQLSRQSRFQSHSPPKGLPKVARRDLDGPLARPPVLAAVEDR